MKKSSLGACARGSSVNEPSFRLMMRKIGSNNFPKWEPAMTDLDIEIGSYLAGLPLRIFGSRVEDVQELIQRGGN